jgi:hypothetical protein
LPIRPACDHVSALRTASYKLIALWPVCPKGNAARKIDAVHAGTKLTGQFHFGQRCTDSLLEGIPLVRVIAWPPHMSSVLLEGAALLNWFDL